MPMVDIDGIGFENLFEFVDKGWSSGLYAQHVKYLRNIVRVRLVGVNFGMRKNGRQIGSLGLEYDVLICLFLLLTQLFFSISEKNRSFRSFDGFYTWNACHKDISDLCLDHIAVLEKSAFLRLPLSNQFLSLFIGSQYNLGRLSLSKADLFAYLKVFRDNSVDIITDFIPLFFSWELFTIKNYANDPWSLNLVLWYLLSRRADVALLRNSIIKDSRRFNKVFNVSLGEFKGDNSS